MSNDSGLYERLGELEINFSVVNEKLGNTNNVLSRMQDSMEKQTELLSKVLIIHERQEIFKEGLDKAQEGISEVVERVTSIEKVQTYVSGWLKGVAVVVASLMIILSFSVKQNIARVDKIENDYYKPSLVLPAAHQQNLDSVLE